MNQRYSIELHKIIFRKKIVANNFEDFDRIHNIFNCLITHDCKTSIIFPAFNNINISDNKNFPNDSFETKNSFH